MAFYVGQKVVFIGPLIVDGGFGWEARPSLGEVYTVRDILATQVGAGLRLQEITNRPALYLFGYEECCFTADRFRPVVDRKTDISIFTAILNTKPAEIDA